MEFCYVAVEWLTSFCFSRHQFYLIHVCFQYKFCSLFFIKKYMIIYFHELFLPQKSDELYQIASKFSYRASYYHCVSA